MKKNGYRSIIGLGVCPYCYTIYKLRNSKAKVRNYECSECGEEIEHFRKVE